MTKSIETGTPSATTLNDLSLPPGVICTLERERARVLRRIGDVVRTNADELAAIVALENGKLLREALLDDMPDTADVFDYYAGWTDKFTPLFGAVNPVASSHFNFTVPEPTGVVGLIASRVRGQTI